MYIYTYIYIHIYIHNIYLYIYVYIYTYILNARSGSHLPFIFISVAYRQNTCTWWPRRNVSKRGSPVEVCDCAVGGGLEHASQRGSEHYPLVIKHSCGKSPFLMGKSTISMVIFHSYVSLSEVMTPHFWLRESHPAFVNGTAVSLAHVCSTSATAALAQHGWPGDRCFRSGLAPAGPKCKPLLLQLRRLDIQVLEKKECPHEQCNIVWPKPLFFDD